MREHMGVDRVVQSGQHARRVRPLRSRGLDAIASQPPARLHDIRDADPEPSGDGTTWPLRREDAIAQVLSLSLTSPPNHDQSPDESGNPRITDQGRAGSPLRDSSQGENALTPQERVVLRKALMAMQAAGGRQQVG